MENMAWVALVVVAIEVVVVEVPPPDIEIVTVVEGEVVGITLTLGRKVDTWKTIYYFAN